jgi:4-amino-4-deoxy-L-arabinose transferase-like glycosyltransferase
MRLTHSLGSIIIPMLLALCTSAMYLPRLQEAPVYLGRDEVFCALSARSIASTGRDLNGRLLPLFFYTGRGRQDWAAPVLVYSVAMVLKVLPFSETAIRLPIALAGIVDVLLMYFIGRLLFTRTALAVLAAVLMALTPTHFVHARLALAAQISGPFVLGWLLCLLVYFRRNNPHLLFVGGLLLAVAAIGYLGPSIAIYGLLTFVALYMRHEAWDRYWRLVAGVALPGMMFVWWFAMHPAAVHDILHHYERSEAQPIGLFGRIADVASLYWGFWAPRFLFVDGALRIVHSTRLIGVFLLSAGGLIVVGVLRGVRQFSRETLLMLGGFFSAPLPASFVGEGHAIWRALEVAPFGVLLAVYGLEYLWTAERSQTRRIAFVTIFGLLVWLSAAYHDYLWHAQALLRASIVPVAVIGLATLFRRVAVERGNAATFAVAGFAALVLFQVAQVFAGYAFVLGSAVALLVALGVAAMLEDGAGDRPRLGSQAAAALVALVSSAFMFLHVEYSPLPRLGFIPASAVLVAIRFIPAAVVMAALGLALRTRRVAVAHLSLRDLAAFAACGFVALQFTYFYIDYFADYRLRMVHGSIVLLGAFMLADFLSRAGLDRSRLGTLAAASLIALASIQFTYFIVDYFTDYQQRESATAEGNVRAVWERVIERARGPAVPAIYFGKLGPYGLEDLFWRFYVIKHNREDLLARTIQEDFPGDIDLDRIRRLPIGALVITALSTGNDRMAEGLVATGELHNADIVRCADGTPTFRILTRNSR